MGANVDTDAVVCEVTVDATPETIFELISDPAKIIRWMGASAKLEPQAGGVFAVDINKEALMRGEILEVEPNRRVVFSFGWEGQGPIAPGSSTVEIDLIAEGKATLVRLTHTGLPAEERANHAEGWNHYLARLAIVAVGGDPGPDKNNM
jgi:uncharacterized protein YndB with AHSA1/START domain